MSYKQTRKVLNIILGAIMVVAFFGMAATNTAMMTVIFILLVGLCFALVYVAAKYFKCPHCGSGFNIRFPVGATHCPFCGGKLE